MASIYVSEIHFAIRQKGFARSFYLQRLSEAPSLERTCGKKGEKKK